GEFDYGRAAEDLLHGLLVVLGVGLLHQHATGDALVPAVELALDDLGQRLFGLALVASFGFEALALTVDVGLRYLFAVEEAGLAEGDMDGDVVGQLRAAALELDQDSVDAASVLDMQIGVENLVGPGLEAHDATELDVL